MIGSRLVRYGMALERTTRKARIWKPKHYQALPYYQKPIYIDPHDTYVKRSKQQVRAELSQKEFDIEYQRDLYDGTDIHRHEKERRAKAYIDISQFNFTELQLDRFRILVGARFKEGKSTVKFSCEMFQTFEQNFDKLNEQIRDVIFEAKRAP